MNLVLTGYRGSGKSTIGQILARSLGYGFVDTDALVEARAGRSIVDIFGEQGEAAFRELESEAVRDVARGDRQVVATGGGVVLDWGNVEALRRGGIVVYLSAPAGVLASRIALDPATARRRPSLSGLDAEAEVIQVLEGRKALYQRAAHFIVDTGDRSPGDVAEDILRLLNPGAAL